MARLDGNTMSTFAIGKGTFAFTGARFDKLGATDYTLVTIAVDVSGSVSSFEDQLRNMLIAAVDACKKNPRSENILVRALLFSSAQGITELHGFKALADIDVTAYPRLYAGGGTPLNDACYSALGATNAYAKQLRDNEFGANAIEFIITDGDENMSVATMKMVKEEQEKAVTSEVLESNISILIGINAQQYQQVLQKFQQEAGITYYKDAGDATPRNLAKLAAFVSQSVSSQSQSLGSGGPSQQISATI